jgi:hypothetical protein
MTTTPPPAGYQKVLIPTTGFMMNVAIDLLLLIISIAPTFKIACALVRFGFFRNSQNVLLYYIAIANVSASPLRHHTNGYSHFSLNKNVAVALARIVWK